MKPLVCWVFFKDLKTINSILKWILDADLLSQSANNNVPTELFCFLKTLSAADNTKSIFNWMLSLPPVQLFVF